MIFKNLKNTKYILLLNDVIKSLKKYYDSFVLKYKCEDISSKTQASAGSGYFNLQRLSDAVQINRNEYKVVFFFRSPLKASDIRYFISNFPNNKDLELLEPTISLNEIHRTSDGNYVNKIHVIGSTTEKNSIYTPNLDLWRGYDLICLVFEK